jgi:hypothetical protein
MNGSGQDPPYRGKFKHVPWVAKRLRMRNSPPLQREAAHAIALDPDRTGVDISVDKD